jgi:hypothetical protein
MSKENIYTRSGLNTTEERTWTFNVDRLNGYESDAPQLAKQAVSREEDTRYRNLRSRLVNQKGVGDTFVTVVEVFRHD